MNRVYQIIATFFGFGYFPVAPGTFGSLGGVFLFYLFHNLPLYAYISSITALFFLGALSAEKLDKIKGSEDNQIIVIDEVVGFLIAATGFAFNLKNILVIFVLFRIFDIIKLPPSNIFDKKFNNGWGVMLDDVFAGIYALIVARIIFYFM